MRDFILDIALPIAAELLPIAAELVAIGFFLFVVAVWSGIVVGLI